MNWYPIPQAIGCVSVALLGWFVLSRNVRGPINRAFAAFSFLTAIWLLTTSLTYALDPA